MHNFLNEQSDIQNQEISEEMRLIARAKLALMLYLNMSEAVAHQYIEKRSVDMRVTKKEIAKNILKTYEP